MTLHFRKNGATLGNEDSRSLFEIMDYRLSPEQFHSALSQLKTYRSGIGEYATYAALMTMIRLRLTRPVAWMSRHQAALRTVLGLK